MNRQIIGALVLAILQFSAPVHADTFAISLDVTASTSRQTATTAVAKVGVTARPILEAKLGERVTAQWKLTNASKETFTDVLVHFYVVRIDRPGQAPPALEPKDVVIESALTMDIAPAGSTSAALPFVPDRPGTYLVRIETPATDSTRGLAYYAAVDLVIK